jgi:hypothetical protein
MSPDVTVVDFGTVYSGLEAVTRYLTGFFANYRTFEVPFEELVVTVLGRDAAMFSGRQTLRRENNSGQRQEGVVLSTGVFRRMGEDWKLVRFHLSGSVRNVGDTDVTR